MDLRDYLSPINPLSCLSHPIHLRCIGSYLSLFLYPFTSSFSLLILYLPSHFFLHPRSLISWVHILPYLLFILTLLIFYTYTYTVRCCSSSHPISKIGGYLYYTLFILPSFCILLLLYLLFNLISLLYLLYYYIFLLPVGCSTLTGLFTSYLSYLSTFTVFLHLLFFSIISLLYYLILYIYLFTRGVTYGLGLHLISISSHCLPYSFYYTRSIRPSMAHTPFLLPVGCSTPYGVF